MKYTVQDAYLNHTFHDGFCRHGNECKRTSKATEYHKHWCREFLAGLQTSICVSEVSRGLFRYSCSSRASEGKKCPPGNPVSLVVNRRHMSPRSGGFWSLWGAWGDSRIGLVSGRVAFWLGGIFRGCFWRHHWLKQNHLRLGHDIKRWRGAPLFVRWSHLRRLKTMRNSNYWIYYESGRKDHKGVQIYNDIIFYH